MSIAEIWSASKACRIPKVYAVSPTPMPRVFVPRLKCGGETIATRVPQPTTCSSTMKPTMPVTRAHSRPVNAVRTRVNGERPRTSRRIVLDVAMAYP